MSYEQTSPNEGFSIKEHGSTGTGVLCKGNSQEMEEEGRLQNRKAKKKTRWDLGWGRGVRKENLKPQESTDLVC